MFKLDNTRSVAPAAAAPRAAAPAARKVVSFIPRPGKPAQPTRIAAARVAASGGAASDWEEF